MRVIWLAQGKVSRDLNQCFIGCYSCDAIAFSQPDKTSSLILVSCFTVPAFLSEGFSIMQEISLAK